MDSAIGFPNTYPLDGDLSGDRTFKIVFKVVFVEAKTCIIFSFSLERFQ